MTNNHTVINELLPFYAGGMVGESQRAEVEQHLGQCALCRGDLAVWQAVSGEIQVADRMVAVHPGLVEGALDQMRRSSGKVSSIWGVYQIIQSQVPLVQHEIWLASGLIMAIGFILAVIAEKAIVIHVLAPMVATVCMAFIYGSENDPAFELVSATQTSQWQILLARLALVFSYNLILALAASLGFSWLVPGELVGNLVIGWLGPMTFLSILALAVSLCTSSSNAITAAYTLWLLQLIGSNLVRTSAAFNGLQAAIRRILEVYLDFWENPGLLLISAGLICIAVLCLVARFGPRLSKV